MTRWERLRYWIADKLFEVEMDEAYRMGIREGYEVTLLEVKRGLEDLLERTPKTKQPGLLLAIDYVTEME